MTAVTISTFKNKHDNNPLRERLDWAQMVKRLSTHDQRNDKDGPLFSAAIYLDGYTRRDEHVAAISLAVADFDNGANWETIRAGLNEKGIEWVAYSTFSSTPEHPRWRVVMPLSKPIPVNLWSDMAQRIHSDLFPEAEPHFDPSRMFYLPSCPPDSLPFTFHNTGRWLDPFTLPEVPKAMQSAAAAMKPGACSPYLRVAIDGELAKLGAAPEHTRNIQLNRSAFALAQFVPSGQIDRSCLEALLEEVALEIGLDPKEIKATLKSGIEAGMKEPREVPEPATRAPVAGENRTVNLNTTPVNGSVRVNAADLQKEAQDPNRPRLEFLPFLGKDGFLVVGFSHLFSGYPKSGKTTLTVSQVLDWARLGKTVLYVTEEPRSVWLERLREPQEGWKNVNLLFGMGLEQERLLSAIGDGDEDVVVIDTIRLLQLRDENDNAEINRVLTPFIAQSRLKEQTLILTHHSNKMGGEYGVAAAGGHAFLGIVDVGLELQRDSNCPKRRKLRGWGRIVEVPELIYELRDNALVPLGDPQEVQLEEVKSRLREALAREFQKTEELREALGEPKPSKPQLLKALNEMASEGQVVRDPPVTEKNTAGKTYRWHIPHC